MKNLNLQESIELIYYYMQLSIYKNIYNIKLHFFIHKIFIDNNFILTSTI